MQSTTKSCRALLGLIATLNSFCTAPIRTSDSALHPHRPSCMIQQGTRRASIFTPIPARLRLQKSNLFGRHRLQCQRNIQSHHTPHEHQQPAAGLLPGSQCETRLPILPPCPKLTAAGLKPLGCPAAQDLLHLHQASNPARSGSESWCKA